MKNPESVFNQSNELSEKIDKDSMYLYT